MPFDAFLCFYICPTAHMAKKSKKISKKCSFFLLSHLKNTRFCDIIDKNILFYIIDTRAQENSR